MNNYYVHVIQSLVDFDKHYIALHIHIYDQIIYANYERL